MAETSMVERVARAMLASDYPDDVGSELAHLWWDRHGATYLRYAMVAIEAMGRPTKKMLSFAWDVHNQHYGQTEATPTEEGIKAIYSAMIDEAIR